MNVDMKTPRGSPLSSSVGQPVHLKPGEMVVLRGKVYSCCGKCGAIVRDKPLLGSLHFCGT